MITEHDMAKSFFFNLQANFKVFRKPIYTPGQYVKLAELQDDFCRFTRGAAVNDRLVTLARDVVRGRTNYPLQCPVPIVRSHHSNIFS